MFFIVRTVERELALAVSFKLSCQISLHQVCGREKCADGSAVQAIGENDRRLALSRRRGDCVFRAASRGERPLAAERSC